MPDLVGIDPVDEIGKPELAEDLHRYVRPATGSAIQDELRRSRRMF